MSYEETGVLTEEEIRKILPPRERLERGPVAIIECIQPIPCDPCVEACKSGAITKKSLVDPPKLDYEKCTGCGECIAICPGLAIFVVHLNFKEGRSLVMIPYEMLPEPERGGIYETLDREGKPIGEARVIAVRRKPGKTLIVSLEVDRDIAMSVRNIGRRLR